MKNEENEEYKDYLKLTKDPEIKLNIVCFIICLAVVIFYTIFMPIGIFIFIYLVVMMIIIFVGYIVDRDNWKAKKGVFTIVDKNLRKVTLLDMDAEDAKPATHLARPLLNRISPKDTIEAIYKFKINKKGEKVYKILKILKVNGEDKKQS